MSCPLTHAVHTQEIIHTHTQLASLRHQLEAVHAALPVAHGTLGGIAAAGAALSRRYPLVHVSKHMVARPDGNDHSRGGKGSDNTNGGSLSPERGHQSYLGPSQLSAEQAAEVDERVALRLTRLTAAFATVGDALRYRPETLTRLAAALAALEVGGPSPLAPLPSLRATPHFPAPHYPLHLRSCHRMLAGAAAATHGTRAGGVRAVAAAGDEGDRGMRGVGQRPHFVRHRARGVRGQGAGHARRSGRSSGNGSGGNGDGGEGRDVVGGRELRCTRLQKKGTPDRLRNNDAVRERTLGPKPFKQMWAVAGWV